MLRRLEDRIRDLCADAVVAQEPELSSILPKLNAALHEHTERARNLVAARVANVENGHRHERRSL